MTVKEFIELIVLALGEHRRPNPRQEACIASGIDVPSLIVAGPGSGKTSVLVLRALRHVLVDRMRPEEILITTFTVKAAKEIRTRLIEWGEPMLSHAKQIAAGDPKFSDFLQSVDVNRFVTGTLDSVCQEALGEHRAPGERRYVVIEGFAADVILSRMGKVASERSEVAEFNDYLTRYTMFERPPRNTGETVRIVRTIIDRFIQDEVNVDSYASVPGAFPNARAAIKRIYERYISYMLTEHRLDFALLEKRFLDCVQTGDTPDMVEGLRAILVDEYQDTNPIQERIYLELARETGATLTVVGDDDQSLYRFRGATIELFRAFAGRVKQIIGKDCHGPIYLVDNYRSSPEIITFYNRFIDTDPDFTPARMQPAKPPIVATRPSQQMPVLGIFRDSAPELADAVAGFLHTIFRGGGRPADVALPEAIEAGQNGDLGDAVLLGASVREFASDRERFPSFLRARLETMGLGCFNPRGRDLGDLQEVQQILGLVLLSLEPGPQGLSLTGQAGPMRLTQAAQTRMAQWRAAAQQLIDSQPPPVRGRTINESVKFWRSFALSGAGGASEWPLLDVFYAFIPWLPGFRDDPEGQVYLEAISRCAAQAASFSSYRGLLLRDDSHRERSIAVAIRDVLAPIAENLVEVDEDIMPSIPRNMLNIMTVHQAKGLEFPLTIVDVASDFTRNHAMQAFRRFPRAPSAPARLEDDLAPCTPIGALRTARSSMQRSFEDIIRLNYVAFSRPQSLLVLVGCIQNLRYASTIKNIALGWRSDGDWTWRDPLQPATALANAIPLKCI